MNNFLLADDSEMFTDMMALALKSNDNIGNIYQAKDADAIKRMLQEHNISVVVLDLHFKSNEYDGVILARFIREHFPNVIIIILSDNIKTKCYDELIGEIKVQGYLDKQSSLKTLLASIDRILKGSVVVDDLVVNKLEKRKLVETTAREQEVLELAVQGLAQKQIGSKLCITSKTVEAHLKNLREKFNVSTTAELLVKYTGYAISSSESYEEERSPFQN